VETKNILIISGFDPFNLAGYGSDIRVATKIGVNPLGVISALTNQNPDEVFSISSIDADLIKQQLDEIFSYADIDSIKIGMLYSKEVIEIVASYLKDFKGEVVVDPVFNATKGLELIDFDSISFFKEQILNSATMIIPNIPEAVFLTLSDLIIDEQCRRLYNMFGVSILLKGGHGNINDQNELVDIFYNGKEFTSFRRKKIFNVNTHGTGCMLSTAISSYLALGFDKVSAIKKAQNFLTNSLNNPIKMRSKQYLSH